MRSTNFSTLFLDFWNRTLHVSDSISFHHQESSTVHTAIGTRIGYTGYADSLLAGSGWISILIPLASCQQTCMTYTITVCTVLDP